MFTFITGLVGGFLLYGTLGRLSYTGQLGPFMMLFSKLVNGLTGGDLAEPLSARVGRKVQEGGSSVYMWIILEWIIDTIAGWAPGHSFFSMAKRDAEVTA